MKKKTPIKDTWYNWLIDYIPLPKRKTAGGFKDKVVSLFKARIPKDYGKQTVYEKEKKSSKPKK